MEVSEYQGGPQIKQIVQWCPQGIGRHLLYYPYKDWCVRFFLLYAQEGAEVKGVAIGRLPLEDEFLDLVWIYSKDRGNLQKLFDAFQLKVKAYHPHQKIRTNSFGEELLFEPEEFSFHKMGQAWTQYCFDYQDFQKAPWFEKNNLPEGVELVPWVALSIQQKNKLDDMRSKIPQYLDYQRDHYVFDPQTSVCAFDDHGLVAFVYNERWDLTTVKYTCFYVNENVPYPSRFLSVLWESIKLQFQSGDYNLRNCIFTVRDQSIQMNRLMEKRFSKNCKKSQKFDAYIL